MLGRGSIPLHPEDQRIVETARDLCQRLHIYKVSPRTVSWVEKQGLVRVPPDQILFGMDNIILSRNMMGKLDPEEWKPLLASALIYYWRYQWKIVRGMLVRTLPAVLLVVPGVVVLDRIFRGQFALFQIIVFTVYLPFSLVVVLYSQLLFFRHMKGLWFKADQEAAELAGREGLLQGLRKIESLGFGARGLSARLMARPSVAQRINRLQSQEPA